VRRMQTAIVLAASCAWLFAVSPAHAQSADKPNPEGMALMNAAKAGKPLWATFTTTMGKLVIELDSKAAPESVATFVGYATGGLAWKKNRMLTNAPLYDGTVFHRVIPGFLIQGGDPTGTSTGGPGQVTADESQLPSQKALHFKRGSVGLAHIPDAHGNGSQFFIVVGDAPWLDGRYTQIGQVVSGLDVADKISNAPRGPSDRPLQPVTLESVRLSERPPARK
jgi:peptidyl-prolyl cis-trans isomerase A (cyclophilin A)